MDPRAAAAFIGTAVSVEDIGYPQSDNPDEEDTDDYWAPLRGTFEVETVLLGEVHETVAVGSGYGGGDCGVDFENRGRVGIVAYADDKGLSTGICGGVWDADHLLEVHGPGSEPLPDAVEPSETDNSGIPVWVWPAALLATGVTTLLLFIKRRPQD